MNENTSPTITITTSPMPTWAELKEQATIIAKSGLAPASFKTAEQIIAASLVARDLGLTPAAVLQGGLYVINGVVSCSSRLMMALLLRSGQVKISIEKGDDNGGWVEVTMARPSAELTYTARWDERRVTESRANIDPKTKEEKWPWKLHRQTMKLWRAIAEAARIVAPDIIGGLYIADEVNVPMREIDGDLVIDAEVIDITPPAPELDVKRTSRQDPRAGREHSRITGGGHNDELAKRMGMHDAVSETARTIAPDIIDGTQDVEDTRPELPLDSTIPESPAETRTWPELRDAVLQDCPHYKHQTHIVNTLKKLFPTREKFWNSQGVLLHPWAELYDALFAHAQERERESEDTE